MKPNAESPFLDLHRPVRVAYACVKPAIWVGLAALLLWIVTVAMLSLFSARAMEPLFLIQLGTGYAIVLSLSCALYIWFTEVAYHQAGYWLHTRYGLHLSREEVLTLMNSWYDQEGEVGEHGQEYGTLAHDGLILLLVSEEDGCRVLLLNGEKGAAELPYQEHNCNVRGLRR